MPIQAELYHQLLNNFVIDYSPTSDTLPVGKRVLRYPLKIPNYAQSGTYKLKVEVKLGMFGIGYAEFDEKDFKKCPLHGKNCPPKKQ